MGPLKYIGLGLLFFFLGSGDLAAQVPAIRSYGMEEGLPSLESYQVKMDREGYLWIATDRGVCRFNGREFQCFDQADGLEDLTVFALKEDPVGRMWAATFNGTLFYHENGRFHPFPYNQELESCCKGALIDDFRFSPDTLHLPLFGQDEVKVTGEGKVFTSPRQKALPTQVNHYPEIETGPFNLNIKQGPEVEILVHAAQGIRRYRLPARAEDGLYFKASLLPLANGDIAAAAYGGVFILHPDGNFLQLPDEFPSGNQSILQDHHGYLWLGSLGEGVRKYDPENGYQKVGHYLQEYSITSVLEDREGGVWLTTLEAGLKYLPNPNILNFSPLENGKAAKFIDLELCDGELYASTHLGPVYRLESGSPLEISWRKFSDDLSLPLPQQMVCFQDRLLINQFEGLSEQVEGEWITWGSASDFQVAGKEKLFTLKQGIKVYSQKGELLQSYAYKGLLFRIGAMDAKGALWLGGLEGIYHFFEGKLTPLHSLGPAFSQRATGIEFRDRIYISTLGQGLLILDPERSEIQQLNTRNGLPNDHTSAVLPDGEGEVWLATAGGLCHLSLLSQGGFRLNKVYTSGDGLVDGEIQRLRIHQGKLWAMAQDGISMIPLEKDPHNREPAPIHLRQARLLSPFDRILSPAADLNHRQHHLGFSFEALTFRNAETPRYHYRLLGLDDRYQTTNQSRVQFLSLSPGDYTFEVKAENSDGLLSSEPARFSFRIRPPWWQTWGFRVGFSLLMAVLLWIGIRWRVRTRNRRLRLELDLLENEQRAVTAQINPHFIYNAMNSVQYYVLGAEPGKAADFLAKSAELMRKVLANTQSSFIPLEAELKILSLYLELEQERFENRFSYLFEVEGNLDREQTWVPTMVVQPHIENAIWHGLLNKPEGEGRLEVRIRSEGGQLEWRIRDNGIGRAAVKAKQAANPESSHTSTGIALTQRRLQLLSRITRKPYHLEIHDLEDMDRRAIGTEVRIRMYQGKSPL